MRRVAPGWEGGGGLVPDKVGVAMAAGAGETSGTTAGGNDGTGGTAGGVGHTRQKSVMEDLVDQLAALDAASSAGQSGTS